MYIHVHIHICIYIYIALMTCYDILNSLTNNPVDFKIVSSVDTISLMNCSFLDSNEWLFSSHVLKHFISQIFLILNARAQSMQQSKLEYRPLPPPPAFLLKDDFEYGMFGLSYGWRHVVMYAG